MPKQHNALYGDDLHNPKGITVDSHASSSKFVISASNMTITASGFTVKATAFQGDGSGLTGVPANDWDGTHSGNGVITGNLEVQGNSSGSITSTGSWGKVEATKFSGDGSGITGITGEWDGSHTGTATFTGNVTASGVVSASGGFVGDGSNLTGVTAEWDGSHTGTAAFTGNVTASGVVSASGGFVGDGSNLTGLTGGIFVETGSIQAYTGDVHITGSVKIGDPGSSTVNDAGDHIVNYSTYKFFEPQLPSGDGDYTHTLSTGDRQSSAIAWEGYSGVSVTDNNGWNGTTDGGTYGFRARNDGTQVGNYAILDMGASYYISEIKMHEKGNGSSGGVNNGNWKWQGSNDNSNWTDIGPAQNVTSSYANQTGITTAITSPGTYRYYKWIATVVGTAYQSAPVSFYELDFKIKGSDPVMTRVLEVGDGGTVSGSSVSTGSFGLLQGDGSGLTNLDLSSVNGFDYTSGSSPVVTTNPSSVGSTWINSTSGEIFVATDITSDENSWLGTAGTTVEATYPFFGSRGVFGGGTGASTFNNIDYITIASTGNATDFGDLTLSRYQLAACSNQTRGVFGGGYDGSNRVNTIDYITIASTGNGTDFGDLTSGRTSLTACSNGVRGVFAMGSSDAALNGTNTIDYITIASTGNGTDFGDLTLMGYIGSACSSETRGLFGGRLTGGSNTRDNTIDYVTIATTGNATDFGDLSVTRAGAGSCSDGTKGLWGGGYTGNFSNVIDYVTIATTGNATDFGDLTLARTDHSAACSDGTKGLWAGGQQSGWGKVNTIDYVTIATTGNATDFGDMTIARSGLASCSGQ